MECKVKDVITREPRPLVVNLTNGEFSERDLGANYLRDGDNVTLEIDSASVSYKGRITDDNMNNFILIRSKKTNKVTFIQVDVAEVFPRIKKEQVAVTSDENNITSSELNKKFGSKRAKRLTEQRERMKLNVEHVRENLEKTVNDVEIEDIIVETNHNPNESDNSYTPPINRDASTKEQVYVLETLVPKTVLDSLEEEATAILENDLDTYPIRPITKKKLLELKNKKLSSSVLKCEIFLYVDCLLSFLVTPVKFLNKTYMACTYSLEVNQHILDNFSKLSGTSRTRSLSMKDKCICYAMVLLLLASDYVIDGEDFAKEVKMGLKKIQEIARVLGLSMSGSTLTLKLPLPAPVTFIENRKRKR